MRHILAFALLVCGLARLSGQSAHFTTPDSVGCDSLLVNFTNTSETAGLNFNYNWNFRNGSTSQEESPKGIWFRKPGFYSVTLTMTQVGNTSNIYTFIDTIIVKPKPNANFFIADTFNLGGLTYRFRSGRIADDTTSYKFEWTLNPREDGTYDYRAFHPFANEGFLRDTLIYPFSSEGANTMKLIVTDYFGCSDSLRQRFVVSERLVIPKAFTPNGDNINDFFIVPTNGRTIYSLQIFALTGQIVFKSESRSIIWDGNMMNGSKAGPGNYLYIIEGNSGGTTAKETGFVMLLRKLQ